MISSSDFFGSCLTTILSWPRRNHLPLRDAIKAPHHVISVRAEQMLTFPAVAAHCYPHTDKIVERDTSRRWSRCCRQQDDRGHSGNHGLARMDGIIPLIRFPTRRSPKRSHGRLCRSIRPLESGIVSGFKRRGRQDARSPSVVVLKPRATVGPSLASCACTQ